MFGIRVGTEELDRLWNLTEDNLSGAPGPFQCFFYLLLSGAPGPFVFFWLLLSGAQGQRCFHSIAATCQTAISLLPCPCCFLPCLAEGDLSRAPGAVA